MELKLYPLLCTRSRRAILRTKKKWGGRYHYSPRIELIINLSRKTGLTQDEIRDQLSKEREWLIKHKR
jgi:hypothetical protein